MSTKDQLYWKILNAAIALDLQKGHLKWSISSLALHCNISRTSVYYYFGKSKHDILTEAVSLIGQELSGSTPARKELWDRGELAAGFRASRLILQQTPELRTFYFIHRQKNNEIGRLIRKNEQKFYKKIGTYFPGAAALSEALFSMFLGIVFDARLSDSGADEAVKIILQGIEAKT